MRSMGGRPAVRMRSDAPRSAVKVSRSTMSTSRGGAAASVGWSCGGWFVFIRSPYGWGAAAGGALLCRSGEDFLEGGDALERLEDAVLAQGLHAVLHGQVAQFEAGLVLDDGRFEVVVDVEQLVDGVAAVVAAAAAAFAADAAVELAALNLGVAQAQAAQHVRLGGVLGAAVLAHPAHEPLGEYPDE